jgi:DNA repair photolyase
MFYPALMERRRVPVTFLEQPCKSALNRVKGMAFRWSLNPYMGCEHRCTFCYVRAYEKRADRPSGDEYGRRVRVKTNIAAQLRTELSRPTWKREEVVIGAATDPYQPAEGRYRLTRACLVALADLATPAGLITRGPMIVRDLDVITQLARGAGVSVNFSVPTLDDVVWRRTEPGTAPPRQRLRALEKLVSSGIRCGVGMAPILPGLSDQPENLSAVVRAAREAGAAWIWASPLYLREGTREHFLAALARFWPDLMPRYESLFRDRVYMPPAQARAIRGEVDRQKASLGPSPVRRAFLEPLRPPEQLNLLAG